MEVYPISEEDRQHNLDLPLHSSLPIKVNFQFNLKAPKKS